MILFFNYMIFCISCNIRLEASFICGRKNIRADALSRRSKDHALSLKQNYFSLLCNHFNFSPSIDLFASRLNTKLPNFFSEGPDPLANGFNAFNLSWPDQVYAFPPINLISKFLTYFINYKIPLGLIITPFWPAQAYFPILLDLLIEQPIIFSADHLEPCNSRTRGYPRHLRLQASLISSVPDQRKAFIQKLPYVSSDPLRQLHSVPTSEIGNALPIGATEGRLVTGKLL